jgi:hypothetical protein
MSLRPTEGNENLRVPHFCRVLFGKSGDVRQCEVEALGIDAAESAGFMADNYQLTRRMAHRSFLISSTETALAPSFALGKAPQPPLSHSGATTY